MRPGRSRRRQRRTTSRPGSPASSDRAVGRWPSEIRAGGVPLAVVVLRGDYRVAGRRMSRDLSHPSKARHPAPSRRWKPERGRPRQRAYACARPARPAARHRAKTHDRARHPQIGCRPPDPSWRSSTRTNEWRRPAAAVVACARFMPDCSISASSVSGTSSAYRERPSLHARPNIPNRTKKRRTAVSRRFLIPSAYASRSNSKSRTGSYALMAPSTSALVSAAASSESSIPQPPGALILRKRRRIGRSNSRPAA